MKLGPCLVVLLPLLLAACGGDTPPPQSFPALRYSYLPPITLKVASINVEDDYLPGPGSAEMIGLAPEAPATALTEMAQDRLVANGSPGTATFVIRRASLDQTGDMLNGTMDVELNIRTSDGTRVGFADASVSRSQTAPDVGASQAEIKAALYDLTKKLMDAMNVELQYQIQRSLPEWLATAPDAAIPPPSASGIAAQPLQPPGGSLHQ
jgi:hypothetical protein